MTWWSVALWAAGMLVLVALLAVVLRGRNRDPGVAPLESGEARDAVRSAMERRL